MNLLKPFGRSSSRRATRQRRKRRLVIEGLETREMLNIDPGAISATSLGVIEFMPLDDLDPSDGDVYYTAEAGRDGFFSLEADTTDVSLILHDADGIELMTSIEKADSQRLDYEADQGDTFIVQISSTTASDVDLVLANLVTHVGDTVTVEGTPGDDEFVFSIANAWRRLTINDLLYDFFDQSGTTVFFNAGVGDDTATLYDSPGDDTFEAGPDLATLSSTAYSVSVAGAENVYAFSTEGGTDTANLYDSPGDDTFVSAANYGKMYGDDFFIRVKSFEYLQGYAKSGGHDRAKMLDSPGRDVFVATPSYAKMSGTVKGTDHFARAKYFETVDAYSTSQVTDFARFQGSDGDDTLTASRVYSILTGQDSKDREFSIRANDFFATRAYDTLGGYDSANLLGTKYAEVFDASPEVGTLHGPKVYLLARGFDVVHAESRYGDDIAHFLDSAGDDHFTGNAAARICKLEGDGFFLRAKDFAEAYAESTEGGADGATFYDSSADDALEALDDWARISSSGGETGYLYQSTGFAPVEANSSRGGNDTASIDSGVTFLSATGNWN